MIALMGFMYMLKIKGLKMDPCGTLRVLLKIYNIYFYKLRTIFQIRHEPRKCCSSNWLFQIKVYGHDQQYQKQSLNPAL